MDTIIKQQAPGKQKHNAKVKVQPYKPYRGIVLKGYRKVQGKMQEVVVGYREPFKPCLADLGLKKLIVA